MVTAAVVAFVESGCNASDYVGFAAGAIALAEEGSCKVVEKVTFVLSLPFCCFIRKQAAMAAAAGSVALLVASKEGGPVYWTAGPTQAALPVFGVAYSLAAGLRLAKSTLTLTTASGADKTVVSENLCAETPGGSAVSVVVVGAHLDSVEEVWKREEAERGLRKGFCSSDCWFRVRASMTMEAEAPPFSNWRLRVRN